MINQISTIHMHIISIIYKYKSTVVQKKDEEQNWFYQILLMFPHRFFLLNYLTTGGGPSIWEVETSRRRVNIQERNKD